MPRIHFKFVKSAALLGLLILLASFLSAYEVEIYSRYNDGTIRNYADKLIGYYIGWKFDEYYKKARKEIIFSEIFNVKLTSFKIYEKKQYEFPLTEKDEGVECRITVNETAKWMKITSENKTLYVQCETSVINISQEGIYCITDVSDALKTLKKDGIRGYVDNVGMFPFMNKESDEYSDADFTVPDIAKIANNKFHE